MKRSRILAFARVQSRARLKRFLAQVRGAARHPEDAEAIHDLRVSIRRFTQCLRAFRAVFDPKPLKKLRRRLRKLMDTCAAVRTCDVAMDVLKEAGVANGRSASISRLAGARAEAELSLRERLKRVRKGKASQWELKLQPLTQEGCEWNLKQDLPGNLGRVLPKLAEDLFAMGAGAAAAGDDHEKLHRFRLFSKRFRYTLELFATFYGAEWGQGLEALRGLQDRLGAINDCVCTIALLGKDRRAMAAVKGLLLRREAEFQEYWRKEFAPKNLAWWKGWLGAPMTRETADYGDRALKAAVRGRRRPQPLAIADKGNRGRTTLSTPHVVRER